MGGRGFDSHAPISAHLQAPSPLGFCLSQGCMQLKKRGGKKKRSEGDEQIERERESWVKSKSPWRIGGGGQGRGVVRSQRW